MVPHKCCKFRSLLSARKKLIPTTRKAVDNGLNLKLSFEFHAETRQFNFFLCEFCLQLKFRETLKHTARSGTSSYKHNKGKDETTSESACKIDFFSGYPHDMNTL